MTSGMGMNEKQGGHRRALQHDARDPDGEAIALPGRNGSCRPVWDAFLVLAQADEGLSASSGRVFRADGSIKRDSVQRMRTNRQPHPMPLPKSNSTALCRGVGDEEGHPIPSYRWSSCTRQDWRSPPAGLMRSGLAHALHHARYRSVFQNTWPITADAGVLRTWRCMSKPPCAGDAAEPFVRTGAWMTRSSGVHAIVEGTSIKYGSARARRDSSTRRWSCLGGHAIRGGHLARHYGNLRSMRSRRGSGNVMCLDVLRACRARRKRLRRFARLGRKLKEGSAGSRERQCSSDKTFRRPDGERGGAAGGRGSWRCVAASAELQSSVAPSRENCSRPHGVSGNHASMYGA